jgi:hypothetical protein
MSKPTITTTYAGQASKQYIAAALLSGTTLENGGVTVMPNVAHKEVIQKVAASGLIKNSTCDFDDQGTVAITERILTLEEFQVNTTFCTKQFVNSWESAELGVSAFTNMPSRFSDFIIANFADQIAANVETNIWTGTNGNAGEIDGYETLWAADADIIDVPSPVAITPANVVAKMGATLDLCPNTIYAKDDLKLYVSKDVMKNYIRALGGLALGFGGGYENRGQMWYNNQALTFDGIPIFMASGMSTNTMALAQTSNLYFGTNVLSDLNEIRVIDTSEYLGDRNARFVARFAYGIQYGIGAEIVLYQA